VANETILVVDGDARSRKVLEVSFRKAGYRAEVTDTLAGARAILAETEPDLIVSDTDLPDGDGFTFCADLQQDPSLARVPFLFVTDDSSLPRRAEGLEIGADDYLTRPFFVNDVIERVEILLRERSRDLLKGAEVDEYEGTLSEITMIDLLQTIDVEERTGTVTFSRDDQQAAMSFRGGEITDAVCGKLQGEDAVYRLMLWPSGNFRVRYQEDVQGADYIDKSIDELLINGIERLEAWDALIEEVPSLDRVFDADYSRLPQLLETVPQEVARVVRLFDGYRTLQDVIDDSPVGDVESLQIIRRLYEDGFLEDVTPEDERRSVREESHLAEWLEQRQKSDESFGRDEPTSPGMPGTGEDDASPSAEIEEPEAPTGSMEESTEPRPSPGPMASEGTASGGTASETVDGERADESEPMAGLADALADEMAGESLSNALDEAAGDASETGAGGQVTEPERPAAPFGESEDSDVRYDAQRTADEHERGRREQPASERAETPEESRPESGFERDAETKEYQEDLAAAERRRRREEARQLTRQKHEADEDEPAEEPARGAPQMPGAREARSTSEEDETRHPQGRDRQSTPRAYPTAQDDADDSSRGTSEPSGGEERYHRPEGETAPMQPVDVSPEQEEQIRAATERRRKEARQAEESRQPEETHEPQGEIPDIERVSENGEVIRTEYELSAPEAEDIDPHEVEARAGASSTREGMAWREQPEETEEAADTTVESRPAPSPEDSTPQAERSAEVEAPSQQQPEPEAEPTTEPEGEPETPAEPEIRKTAGESEAKREPQAEPPADRAAEEPTEEDRPPVQEPDAPEDEEPEHVAEKPEQVAEERPAVEEETAEPEDEEETAVVDDPAEAFFQGGDEELEEGWDFEEDYDEDGGLQTWHYGAIAAAVLGLGVVLWVLTPFGGVPTGASGTDQRAEAVGAAEGGAAAEADETDEETGLTESEAQGRSEDLAKSSLDEATTLAQVLGGDDPYLAGAGDAGLAAPPRPDAAAMAQAKGQDAGIQEGQAETQQDEGAGPDEPAQQQAAAETNQGTGQGAQQQGGGSPQPDPTQQRIQRASQLVNGGSYGEALRLLRQLRKEVPGSSRVATLYLQVASGYQTGGNPERAREVYQEYLNTWPSGQMASEVRSIMQRL
jgi:DNA-binding response OmpR family regulator